MNCPIAGAPIPRPSLASRKDRIAAGGPSRGIGHADAAMPTRFSIPRIVGRRSGSAFLGPQSGHVLPAMPRLAGRFRIQPAAIRTLAASRPVSRRDPRRLRQTATVARTSILRRALAEGHILHALAGQCPTTPHPSLPREVPS